MTEPDTLPRFLKRNYDKWGDTAVAFRDKDYGIWNEYTWKDAYEQAKYFGLGMVSLGLQPGDRVSIIGDNEPQWYWASFGIQAVGGVTVALFTDAIPPEIKYIVEHSDSRFVVARDQEQVDKFLTIGMENLPKVEKVIWWYWRGMKNYDEPFLLSFNQVVQMGWEYEREHVGLFEQRVEQANSEDICYIYYTSGTTGLPKGALMSHRTFINCTKNLYTGVDISEKDDILGYLPPAWVGEAWFGIVPQLMWGARMNTLEEPELVFENTREIAPAVVLGGPRQWEGWVSLIRSKIDDAGFVERFSYNLLMPVAFRWEDFKMSGVKPSLFWRVLHLLADGAMLRPLRDRLGLTRIKMGAAGGAYVGIEIFRFMHALGIDMRVAYGSTEAGGISYQRQDYHTPGSLGMLLPGVEARISDNQEIVARSNMFFSGYHKNPEAYRRQMIGGWWYSGDAGYLDENGELYFLDRVDEMVDLTSGAKYAPQHIESGLRYSTYIRDAITFGRDFVAAIIDMDYENTGRWAEKNHVSYTTYTDLSQKPQVGELIRRDVERVNRHLPEAMRVRKFAVLHKEFDPDEADLTRTRKLKRSSMEQRYMQLVDALHSGLDHCLLEAPITYQDGRKGVVSTKLNIYSL